MRRLPCIAVWFVLLAAIASTAQGRAHALYSTKGVTYHGVAFYSGFPYAYSDNVNQGINQYRSGSYTVVTEDNWGSVVPYGLTFPTDNGEPVDVAASASLIDGNGNWWSVPNNYPYCFVGSEDAYSCGDSRTMSHSVYNPSYNAKAQISSWVFTFDDTNSYLHETPTWQLSTF